MITKKNSDISNPEEYECSLDQENDTTHTSANSTSSITSFGQVVSNMEPAIDYDDRQNISSFNCSSTKGNNNNSLVMMLSNKGNLASQSQSPLTPRQIKQRNTAKRNSIPHSKSNSSPYSIAASSLDDDLQFLQAQKFDTEFLTTTKELFQRFPNAKISISVTLSSLQNDLNSNACSQQRQIEIDRLMFERLCASTAAVSSTNTNNSSKLQPKAPIRTSSVPSATCNFVGGQSSPGIVNNNNLSVSSSSPSSSSSSSSAYDSSESSNFLNFLHLPASLSNIYLVMFLKVHAIRFKKSSF